MKATNLEIGKSSVFILVVEHHYGVDIWAHSTKEKAEASLEKYAMSWWDHEIDTDEPPPAGRENVIKRYFECVPYETYRITKLQIDDKESEGR
jgi:hypothetical protein